MNWNFLNHIASSVSTPFFILDEDGLIENYKTLLSTFKNHYEDTLIAYACKANNCYSVLKNLSKAGAWIEASSSLEYQGIVELGHPAEKIIFNGPLKTETDWLLIQKNNSLGHIDSIEELQNLCSIAALNPHKIFNIGLRLRLANSRFGISVNQSSMQWIKESLVKYPNVQCVSLHGHASYKRKSLEHFINLTRFLLKTAEEHFPDKIQSINLGGGILHPEFPSSCLQEPTPSWEDYGREIANTIKESHWARAHKPKLCLEPGAGLVANTFKMVTKVIQVEKDHWVTVDTSALQVKPTQHKFNMPFTLVKRQPKSEYCTRNYNVYGPTCWEDDLLLNSVMAEFPKSGDYLMIHHVGAYTISLMPGFIIPAPAIVSLNNNNFRVLHPRQSRLHPTAHL